MFLVFFAVIRNGFGGEIQVPSPLENWGAVQQHDLRVAKHQN